MKCLITGGAGFIGSHIVKELVKKNNKVKVLDNLSTGNLSNIKDVIEDIEFIKADIRDKEIVYKITKDVDYILHQAAIPSVIRSINNPLECNDNNLIGTLNLLYAAKENKVKRFIYASSSSVYGDIPKLPKEEDDTPQPISPYGVSKLAGEYYCKVFYKIYGLETVILRYFNVFGENQNPNSEYSAVIPRFIFRMLKNQPPIIYGDGNQTRDFTYVSNVVEANIQALTQEKAKGQIFNIASGRNISIKQLVELINSLLGKNLTPIYQSSRKGDIKHSLASIDKAKKILNYELKVGLEEGLRLMMEWLKS
jgi:nucleoside-diphosphate-sugar epimerase